MFGTDAKIVLSTLNHSFQHLRDFPLAALPTMQAVLVSLGIVAPVDPWPVFSKGLRPSDLANLIDPTLVSTDDRPLPEFSRTGDVPSWFFSND